MAAVPQSLSGLASILSSEPMPQMPMLRTNDPVRIAAEIELYVRNLHLFLKRLFGQFTATNLLTTINQGTGVGFDKIIHLPIHYKGTDNLSLILDSTYDWRRALGFFYRVTVSSTSAAALISSPDYVFCGVTSLTGAFAGFPLNGAVNFTDGISSLSIDVQTNGNLLTQLNQSGVSHEFWIEFTLAAIVGVEKNSSSFLSRGNGL